MRKNKIKQIIVDFYNKGDSRSDKIVATKKKKLRLIK